VQGVEPVHPRRQDTVNRQGSHDDLSAEDLAWWDEQFSQLVEHSQQVYQEALARGFSKESARFACLMASSTTLYINGTVRDWIWYITVRTYKGAQKEHQDVANACKRIFCEQMPVLGRALNWIGGDGELLAATDSALSSDTPT
jgi:thymidylate synthase (FAD)